MTDITRSDALTGDQKAEIAAGYYEVSGRAAFVSRDGYNTVHVHYGDGSWTCFYPETFRALAVKKIDAQTTGARVIAQDLQSNEEGD